ncbi:hypothetical protein [Acidisphaera sp. L21]|uniref:hypothetical protein n=1 Tax=Acidisphaera sp. L21 TaxID=1641851 RepID=UPI00131C9CD9|nr:hypothetical protein [Acidisphaera sp. L21]
MTSDQTVEISLQTLLYAFPRAAGWMPGAGKYSAMLTTLLDSGTTLIEEILMPSVDDASVEWLVRLTPKGIVERANGDRDPAPCAAKGWHTADHAPARLHRYSQRDR